MEDPLPKTSLIHSAVSIEHRLAAHPMGRRGIMHSCVRTYVRMCVIVQEAQLSSRDRAMRRVS